MEYLGGPAMLATTVSALREGRGAISPRTGDLERDASILIAEELERLAAAELFFVDPDMTRLAAAAAETLPVHGLHPTDVPAPSGLCVFAEPIATYANDGGAYDGELVHVVAVSWGDSPLMNLTPDRGVWMTQWASNDVELVAQQVHQRQGVPLARARTAARQHLGPLAWENEVTLLYGPTPRLGTLTTASEQPVTVQEVDDATRGADIAGGTMHTAMIVRAAWLLMTQPGVTDIETEPLSRAERRRAQRDGRDPPVVRVVRIRHQENRPSPHTDSSRNYGVRWTVRGHWRRQWYPSRGDHRPIWINPHVKGPDDAPLHAGETVHLLDSRDRLDNGPDPAEESGREGSSPNRSLDL